MSKLAVKYDNKMNLLAFKDLEKVEANLFFSIVARLKDKGTESVVFSFSELTEFLDKNLTTKETIDILNKGVGKIVRTAIRWETDTQIILFTLFQEFIIDKQNKTLQASISPKFLYILNNFKDRNFTMFELAEFSSLSSKYTQTLYRLLKQFRTTGYLTIKWAEFVEIMDIPKSYQMCDIERRILKPSIAELTQEADIFNQNNPIFKKLLYKKIRGKGKGRPVESIEFYFTPEPKRNEFKEMIQNLAKTEQEMEKNSGRETKFHILTGEEVTELTPYISQHFSIKNQEYGGYDTCKIKDLKYIDKDDKKMVWGLMLNQENYKEFEMFFDSIAHMKNALKIN